MTKPARRPPAVAGMFYPSNPSELRTTIDQSFRNRKFGPGMPPPSLTERKIYGMVTPHAGYMYSGAVAANGYYQISSHEFSNAVIVGPNHYGIGSGVATMKGGVWETPLGQVEVNGQWAEGMAKRSGIVDFDDMAHSRDHCLEVQLPFLQYIRDQFTIVPVILMMQDIDTAYDLGKAIADTAAESDDTVLIASSDLTHYEPNESAHKKDSELISTMLELNVPKFYSVLERMDVSACGYGAIASIMVAAKSLGATRGELLKYATSGDVTGDTSAVVGYSSVVFV
ncbi:MAG: MEMO1 family protein [Nitrososphaera sp.]|uniref:MEMO1 family protein n=1 Tax=Nitrososphaera sp. TaxID=1971748 RepID=UPI0025CBF7BF|nr:MEMO1 family protein [Nitrososphaera sp.]